MPCALHLVSVSEEGSVDCSGCLTPRVAEHVQIITNPRHHAPQLTQTRQFNTQEHYSRDQNGHN